MQGATELLGNNPGVALLSVVVYYANLMMQLNEVISTLTGIGALFLLCLTIVGKWKEIRKNKGKDEANG